MCLEQETIGKAIPYYNDKEKRIIVMKAFNIYNNKLFSAIGKFIYEFTINKDKSLLVKKSNRKQVILLSINSFSGLCRKLKSKILGYHCSLFNECTTLSLSDWENCDFIRIPIIVNLDDVQEISSDEIVTERFTIMNPLEFEKILPELLEHAKCFYRESQIKSTKLIIDFYNVIYNNILKNNVRGKNENDNIRNC